MARHENGEYELVHNENDDIEYESFDRREYLSQYMKDYFLDEVPLNLSIMNNRVPLLPYKVTHVAGRDKSPTAKKSTLSRRSSTASVSSSSAKASRATKVLRS